MTKVLIVGGGGMIGQQIAGQLAQHGLPGGPVGKVTLIDKHIPENGASHDVAIQGELGDGKLVKDAVADRPDVIFHLAAAVSGECEEDFDLGWRVNLELLQMFLEEVRSANEADGYRPRLVFASSCAVYGGPLPDVVPDDFHLCPQSSYGHQKVVGEMLVSDYARKGFMEGISLRLPSISVRPGKPNKAASSCFSGIIREPLNGEEAILPIPETTRHSHASPRSAAGFFRHATGLDLEALDGIRALTMPGLACTVEEQIDSLRRAAGPEAVELIKKQPDPMVMRIVSTWPQAFSADLARELGFKAEESYDEIVQAYLEDHLSQSRPAAAG